MSATVVNENKLAELITKACGPRSLSEYSRACGISPAHLSRVKSGICRPSKKMCFKLASERYAKEIGLSSQEFLIAAGYNGDEIESTKEFEAVAFQQSDVITLGIVSKRLMLRGCTYQLLSLGENKEVDFAFLISQDGTKVRWEFVLNFSYQTSDYVVRRNAYYYNLGRILSFQPIQNTQYTLILNDEVLYDELVQEINRDMVLANVSVALIDFEAMEIKKEVILGRGGRNMKLSLI